MTHPNETRTVSHPRPIIFPRRTNMNSHSKARAFLVPLFAAFGTLCLLNAAPASAADPADSPRFGFDGFLLGAFIDGQWVTHNDLQENERYRNFRIWGGEECRVYRFGGPEGEGVATADPRDHQDDHPGEKYTGPDTHTMPAQTPSGNLGPGDARLTVIGGHDAMPRKAQVLPPDNPTYKKIVADHLASRGLSGAEAKIVQLVRVDLDGDGTDEVLIAAQNVVYPDDGAQAELFSFAPDEPLVRLRDLNDPNGVPAATEVLDNSSSLILLRKVEGGAAQNVPLAEFIAKKGAAAPPRTHKIAAAADLNGDGVMEVILAEAASGSLRYRVYEVKGATARPVLENGVGGR